MYYLRMKRTMSHRALEYWYILRTYKKKPSKNPSRNIYNTRAAPAVVVKKCVLHSKIEEAHYYTPPPPPSAASQVQRNNALSPPLQSPVHRHSPSPDFTRVSIHERGRIPTILRQARCAWVSDAYIRRCRWKFMCVYRGEVMRRRRANEWRSISPASLSLSLSLSLRARVQWEGAAVCFLTMDATAEVRIYNASRWQCFCTDLRCVTLTCVCVILFRLEIGYNGRERKNWI